MARALIVGCGCRGRELAAALLAAGWRVRGTSRRDEGLATIEGVGAEASPADPERIGTVVEQLEGVSLIYWLLGSAVGDEEQLAALHGPRLERLLEEIVDTPVRGVVYEGAGSVAERHLRAGANALESAGRRWRIPGAVTRAQPAPVEPWREEMVAAAERLLAGGPG